MKLGFARGSLRSDAVLTPLPRSFSTVLVTLCVTASLAAIVSCSAFGPRPEYRVTPRAQDLFEQGVTAQQQDRRGAALAAFKAACEDSPDFVDAHRAYQNLKLLEGRSGDLLVEYGDRLRREPESAIAQYLYSRLSSDATEQVRGFERALEIDPDFYFARVGLGHALTQSRRPTRAAQEFEAALRIDASRAEAWRGRLRILMRRPGDEAKERRTQIGKRILELDPTDTAAMRAVIEASIEDHRDDDAFESALRFLMQTRAPGAPQLLLDVLKRQGTSERIDRARAMIAAESRAPLDDADWLELLVFLEQRSGDPRAALRWIDSATEDVRASYRVRTLRREMLLSIGAFDRYLDDLIDSRFSAGFELDRGRSEAELRDVRRAAFVEGIDAADARRYFDVMLRHGLTELAIEYARARLEATPTDGELRLRLREALGHRRFVTELAAYFREQYRDSTPKASFDEFVATARRLSQECFGRDVVDPVVTKDFFPIGSFLDPDPSHGSGLARHFDRYGQFFLVGSLTIGSLDGYLLRRIAETRPEIDGRSVYRVAGEELLIPSRVESLGGQIAGFAFETFIVLNVDRARDTAERTRAIYETHEELQPSILDDAIEGVTDPDSAVRISEPASVQLRTWYRAYADFLSSGGQPAAFAGDVLDSVEVHERTHIRDARELLPIYEDLPDKIAVIARKGFSFDNVQAWLEARAQAVALVGAKHPRLVLAEILRYAADREMSPPHSIGYHDMLAALVKRIAAEPEKYPDIRQDGVIVQQLDRLSDEQLRALGKRLLEVELFEPNVGSDSMRRTEEASPSPDEASPP